MPSLALGFAQRHRQALAKQEADLDARFRKSHRRVAELKQELADVDQERGRYYSMKR